MIEELELGIKSKEKLNKSTQLKKKEFNLNDFNKEYLEFIKKLKQNNK